jgi:hypothetical protein
MSMNIDAQQPTPARAVRLIFEYDGDQVRLISEQPVDMAVTAFDLSTVSAPGYYVDSRDAEDRTLARVRARGAFDASMEVFPENPEEPITRIDVPRAQGAFTVVVPAPEQTDHVTILRVIGAERESDAPGARGAMPAAGTPEQVDLVSFPLKPRE